MIVNIVDHRTNSYNTLVCAIIEPAYRDNNVDGATSHINDVQNDTEFEFKSIQLVEAIERGNDLNGSFTLYIYDRE